MASILTSAFTWLLAWKTMVKRSVGHVDGWIRISFFLERFKSPGLEDILIACTDNLKGFTDDVKRTFPDTVTQLCVVHRIRNSCHWVLVQRLGLPYQLFWFSAGNPKNHLYHQYHRKPEPGHPKTYKNESSVTQWSGRLKGCLHGYY